MNTNKIRATQNEIEILKALANNGWMTTRLIALWVWHGSTEHVAVNKAQLVLKRLKSQKEVIERTTPVGMKAWVLTNSGADRVNMALISEGAHRGWAHHGYDLSTLHFQKHVEIVEYLIAKKQRGAEVFGKAALRAGILHELFGEFDAVVEYKESSYIEGVLKVSNCAESTENRIARCRKICSTHLIGDPLVIRGLQKRIGHKEKQDKY